MNAVDPIKSLDDIRKMKEFLAKKPRNALLFSFGINSGLRISDILALNVGDVRDKEYIEIRELKTGKRKIFPINDKLKKKIEEFSSRDKWDSLNDIDYIAIKDRVSHLPTTLPEEDEHARRFDLMILNTQLAYYARDMVKFEKYQKNIKEIAFRLEGKTSIPQVKENIELIENLLTEEFWMNITISVLEEIRIKLRDLIGLIDFEQRKIVYSHFEDELDQTQGISLDPSNGVDIAQYRKKVTAFLQAHENDICINKLKFNKPLTETDVQQLEKILFENSDIGSKEQLKVLQQNLGLGEFIRSIIGVERSEIEKIFSEYLDNNKFNSNQIRFVETIIDYIRNNGTMDTAKLFEQPFTFINAEGLDGVFAPKDADNIIYLIDGINQNAHILEG